MVRPIVGLTAQQFGRYNMPEFIEDIYGSTWRRIVADGQAHYEWRETNNNNAQWKRHSTDKVPSSIIDELGGAV